MKRNQSLVRPSGGKDTFVAVSFSLFLSILLSGCGAEMALVYLPQLIQAGGSAISGLENVEVKTAVPKGITEEEFKKIKKLGVVIGSTNPAPQQGSAIMGGGNMEALMMDNISLELMNMGYVYVLPRNQKN